MTRDPWESYRDALSPGDRWILATGFLLPVAATLLLPPTAAGWSALLWLLVLLPILLLSYVGGWRGTAVGLAVGLGLLFLSQTLAAGVDRASSPFLTWMVAGILLLGAGTGWVMERIRRDQGDQETLALTDSMTGLPNQRHARVFLETVFGGAERGRSVAVVLFDLDDLEGYNQRNGRAAGDEALVEFARFLEGRTRRMNLSARLGREEFISILADSDDDGARAFAERVREAFAASRLIRSPLTVSAGVATYHPSMRNPDELIAAADLALHRAKQEGRNRVRVFGRDVGPLGALSPDTPGVPHSSVLPDRGAADPDEDDSEGPGWTGAGGLPAVAGTDPDPRPPSPAPPRWAYPRGDAEIGRTPPAVDLLPRPILQYGQGRRILLVLRDEGTVRTVAGYLGREGFQLRKEMDTAGAAQALGEEFDAILVEIAGADFSGMDFIQAAKSRWPATQLLVLAQGQDAQRAAEALAAGADRYLFTPVRMRALQSILVDVLARRDRLLEARRDRDRLGGEGPGESEEIRRPLLRGLLSLVRAQELRDPFTHGHGRRVADYSLALLDRVGGAAQGIDRERFRLACLVHDLGKIEVPARILNKAGALTPDEFDRVRAHPETGRTLLAPLLGDELTLAVAGWHHERWDGSGYPDGLAGEAIPLAARIVALADALDAMTSARAYRPGLAWEDAIGQVRDRAGSHFDPGLVAPFNEALPVLRRHFEENPPPSPVVHPSSPGESSDR
jgi:putative two-component system response regulator